MSGATAGRFRQVDALRGLAALSVVYFHAEFAFPNPPPSQAHSLTSYLTQRTAGPPITAVVLFFLISGFVLYRPFVGARFAGAPSPALGAYALRRFARIVPAYWVALALVAVWLGYGYIWHPGGFIRYFGFLQLYGNVHTLGGGIPVGWTLCVEVTFYALLPVLALAARRLGRTRSIWASELVVLGAMTLVSLVYQLIITVIDPYSTGWVVSLLVMLPGCLDLFAAGMLLAILSVEHEHRATPRRAVALVDRAPWLCWLVGLALLFAEGRIPRSAGVTGWWMSAHALKLLGCLLLLAPAAIGQGGLLRRVLGSRPLVWLGTVSYGIYLWHDEILHKFAPQLIPKGLTYTTVTVAVLSVIVGALSYYLIERPSQRLARRLIVRRRAAPAPAAPPAATAVP